MTHKTMSSKSYYKKKPTGECGKNRNIVYKQSRVRGPVYVLPAQVMSSQVDVTFIGTDIHLQMSEYQWLCDSIGQFWFIFAQNYILILFLNIIIYFQHIVS